MSQQYFKEEVKHKIVKLAQYIMKLMESLDIEL